MEEELPAFETTKPPGLVKFRGRVFKKENKFGCCPLYIPIFEYERTSAPDETFSWAFSMLIGTLTRIAEKKHRLIIVGKVFNYGIVQTADVLKYIYDIY